MNGQHDGPTEFVHERILEASRSGDLTAVLSLFADDAVMMPPNDSTLYGTDEISDWWKEYFQWFTIVSSVETESVISIIGDQAIQRATFSVIVAPKEEGAKIRDDIRSLTVWQRQPDGVWKISRQMWNSMRPVGSGTNRYLSRMIQKKTS